MADDYAKDNEIPESILKRVRASRMKDAPGTHYWWETPTNAAAERARAFIEAGVTEGHDIELPSATQKKNQKAVIGLKKAK